MSGSEQPSDRAWRSFVRAKGEMRRVVHRDLRARGLTGAQFEILRVLAESGEASLKLNEISQKLFVTCGNVTGLVDRLEESGLLTRVAHPEDRRITLATLTSAGRELFSEISPLHEARVEQVMSALSANEQARLAQLLDRLSERAMGID